MKNTVLEKEGITQETQKISNYIDRSFDLTEIINGEEIMAPSPFSKHQRIVARLYNLFQRFNSEKNLGEVFISPLDVILEEGVNRLQPDLILIKKENLHIVRDWIRGVPDLVVEIASEGSITVDSVIKKEIYERYGVGEFWLIFPEGKTIQVYSLEDKRYKLFSFAEIDGIVRSKTIAGLEIDVKEVFKE